MPEEKKTETTQGQIHQNDFGTIRVDDGVAASVAAIALNTIEGISHTIGVAGDGFIGNVTDSFTGMLGKKPGARGVRVDYKNDGFYIIINVKVLYGYCIPDLAHEIQRKVKQDIEQMIGMKVRSVDVFIQGLDFNNSNDTVTGDQHA